VSIIYSVSVRFTLTYPTPDRGLTHTYLCRDRVYRILLVYTCSHVI